LEGRSLGVKVVDDNGYFVFQPMILSIGMPYTFGDSLASSVDAMIRSGVDKSSITFYIQIVDSALNGDKTTVLLNNAD
jgi:hypothetical protein